MINAGALRITWPDQWLGVAFEARKASFPAEWRLYVESLDGATGRPEVLAALKYLGLLPQSATDSIIPRKTAEGLDLSDDRIFPGYDAVWITTKPENKNVSPPTFITYMAAEQKDALPRSIKNAREEVPWGEVEAWMSSNEIFVGFATGAALVVIERLTGRTV